MMFYGGGGWNPWMVALMIVGMLLFWGFVIWGGLLLFRGSRSGPSGSTPPEPGQVLNQRLPGVKSAQKSMNDCGS
jgi:hypothetical protein